MNSFSFNRFGKMLRWVLSVNFKRMLGFTIAGALGWFLAEMIIIKMTGYNVPFHMVWNISQFGVVAFLLMLVIFISTVVYSVNSKRKREAFLMLPASNLEKFLALVFYTTIVLTLCLCLALVIGDSLRMGWMWIDGPSVGTISIKFEQTGETWHWWSSAIPQMVESLTPNVLQANDKYDYSTWYITMQLLFMLAFTLWIHSLFTLGGVYLRKYSFVLTGLFFILCMVLLVKFVHAYDINMFTSHWENGTYISEEVGTLAYVLTIVLPLLSIFNYWTSFRIFKGFQLITNKWTNYDILKR